jgi:hypothetical protein
MATDILEFLPIVAPAAPMCPTKIIKEKIIEACRKFCHETKLWVVQVEEQDLVAATAAYDLTTMIVEGTVDTTIAEVGDIVAIDHVEIDNYALRTTAEAFLNEQEYGWRSRSEQVPRRFMMGPDRQIVFVYTPSQNKTGGVSIWLSMKPLWAATEVEDFFFTDWRKAIEYAAQAYLLEIPKMPWSDEQAAMVMWAKFANELEDAFDHKMAGYGDHQAALYMRPSGRGY